MVRLLDEQLTDCTTVHLHCRWLPIPAKSQPHLEALVDSCEVHVGSPGMYGAAHCARCADSRQVFDSSLLLLNCLFCAVQLFAQARGIGRRRRLAIGRDLDDSMPQVMEASLCIGLLSDYAVRQAVYQVGEINTRHVAADG